MAQAYSTPSIPPDALHVSLYPPSTVSSSHGATLAYTVRLRAAVDGLLPAGWTWHRDSFDLHPARLHRRDGSQAEREKEKWVMRGGMRVGESIEDEWVGVWLVRELTRQFEGLTASVYDADGDFLLIEAASVLPSWVTPQNSENRLFIHQGQLHLVPLSITSPATSIPARHERRLTLDDEDDEEGDGAKGEGWLEEWKGVEEVRSKGWRATEIEAVISDRISCYPQELSNHHQRTTLYLPTPIALALSRTPDLIQKAVEAFYTRDPSQLRRVAKMTRFSPTPDNTSRTQVRLTRVAFAQLEGQEFHPSKAFGPEWSSVIGDGSQEGAERARGVKVAVGFEILCTESKARPLEHPELDSSTESAATRLAHLRLEPAFETYLSTLRKAGWFEDEMEGSQRYKEREEEATRAWMKLKMDENSTRPTFSTLFETALSLPGPSSSELAPKEPDSDVSWLQVDPSSLDGLMASRSGTQADEEGKMDLDLSLPEDERDGEEVDDGGLGKMADRVGKFVGAEGRLEGAVFDDELMEGDSSADEDDAKLEEDMMQDDGSDDDDDDDEREPPATLSLDERAARMARLVQPLEPGQWGASTQIAPSSTNASADDTSSSTPKSTFGVDDAQRKRDEIDRQAKLHALGELDAQPRPTVKIRRPVVEKESFDGVDSDDESSSDEALGGGTSGSGMMGALKEAMKRDGVEEDEDEDMPQVVDEVEVDMDEEEGEFLKFAREALGLDEQMWEKIVGERQERGAFVPGSRTSKPAATSSSAGLKSAALSTKPPPASTKEATPASAVPTSSAPTPADFYGPSAPLNSNSKGKGVTFSELPPLAQSSTDAPDFSNAPMFMPGPEPEDASLPMRTRREKPREVPEGAVPNQALNSFDAVMAAMDEHLAQTKAAKAASNPPSSSSSLKLKQASTSKPKATSSPAKATPLVPPTREQRDTLFGSTTKPPLSTPVYDSSSSDDDDDDANEDELLAMDAELRSALAAAGDLGLSDDEDVENLNDEDKLDYGLIKNFLESYKAQGGMAGPVGNLLGRLKEKDKK